MLIFVGILSAAGLAYGCSSYWAEFSHGVQIIVWSRQLLWPLVLISLAAAMALILLVIAGKRRAWWLIGLAPILALFVHRFSTGPASAMSVLEHPPFVPARDASGVDENDYVVGVRFGDDFLALPYACLYAAPVVVHQERDQRFILIWSAPANRALAFSINREIKARELEAVSIAANALLVYNARYGEFINGVTGRTLTGQTPIGFGDRLPTWKLTWSRWRDLHPDTRVLSLHPPAHAPRAPIVPHQGRASGSSTQPIEAPARVILVGTDNPVALSSDQLDSGPVNLTADDIPIVVWRDPRSGLVRAFDRRLADDLTPRFEKNTDAGRAPAMVDTDTGCGWSYDGIAVDGDKRLRGTQLRPTPIEEDVYRVAIERWFPQVAVDRAETRDPSSP